MSQLLCFIDESGDHSLEVIDPEYPMFVLGGCIVEMDYYKKVVVPEMDRFKNQVFGTKEVILHTADIVRRRREFRKLTDEVFRKHFYDETNKLMQKLDYKVVACCIKKDEHLKQYGIAAMDPYLLSLRVIVERFVYEVQTYGKGKPGILIAESRDETLDNLLRLAWMELRTSGTEYVTAVDIRKNIEQDLKIRDKKKNIHGLQLVDLIVSPIGRRILGKSAKADWNIIKNKFRKNTTGNYWGFGLVVLPKKQAAPE